MEQSVPQQRRYTLEEFIRLEDESEEKHEYRDGEIISMAGGSLSHSGITANVIHELGNKLAGPPCRVFDSNLRIQIAKKKLHGYSRFSKFMRGSCFPLSAHRLQNKNLTRATKATVCLHCIA